MSDIIVVENGGQTVVQVTQSPATVLEIVDSNPTVVVQTAGVQGPPGPQGTPGVALVNFTFDGGGSNIAVGTKGAFVVPFNCTITAWTLLADNTGSVTVDVLKSTFAGYPTATSIAGTSKPQIVSSVKGSSSTLTGWSPAISEGEIVTVNIDSASGIGRVTLGLSLTRV